MKKILVILIVLASLVSCGILEDHSEWYNEQKKTSKLSNYGEVVKEIKETEMFKSVLEPDKTLTLGEGLAEAIKCYMLLSDYEDPEFIDLDKFASKLEIKITDNGIIYEFKTKMHYAGYISDGNETIGGEPVVYVFNPLVSNRTYYNAISINEMRRQVRKQIENNDKLRKGFLSKESFQKYCEREGIIKVF
ncbi:hypothetical protein [Fusobacterium nucleatum]|uniref:hypothetical protein n=1 Tax=Fusobacterium nucleatum TaxID=851 RepID=UPI0030D0F411